MEGYLFTPHPRSSETCLQGKGFDHFFFLFQNEICPRNSGKKCKETRPPFFTELMLKLRQSIEPGRDVRSIIELTTCARAPIRLTSSTDHI